jgi:hypothetical protein
MKKKTKRLAIELHYKLIRKVNEEELEVTLTQLDDAWLLMDEKERDEYILFLNDLKLQRNRIIPSSDL